MLYMLDCKGLTCFGPQLYLAHTRAWGSCSLPFLLHCRLEQEAAAEGLCSRGSILIAK